jgi:hypothetical protein
MQHHLAGDSSAEHRSQQASRLQLAILKGIRETNSNYILEVPILEFPVPIEELMILVEPNTDDWVDYKDWCERYD